MNITLNFSQAHLPTVLFWLGLWTLLWLIVLATVLTRKDFDPVTRLTWVLVIILVPVFGVVVYWVVASKAPQEIPNDATDQPTTCVKCRAVIPPGSRVCPNCGWSYTET